MKQKKLREINENTPLMTLAGPMFIEMLLSIFLNNIDTLMLSHYSELAVGAVGNANQIMSLLIMLFNIVATSTSVVAAQYLGAKKQDQMNKIYTLALMVNAFGGLAFSGVLLIAKGAILRLLKVPHEMVADANLYLTIVGGFLFLHACFCVMMQILRCNGRTKPGMYISLLINLVNIGGNYCFLYGPLKHLELGVKGVAISTVTARVVAVVLAFILFYHYKIGKISVRYIKPFPWDMLVKMFKISIPAAGENLAYSLYQMVLLAFINTMGNDSVNAKVYCSTLIAFAMVFSNASASATQIIVGHLVGAQKEEAAYKRVFASLKLSIPITIGIAMLNWLVSPYTLRLFTQNENIIRLGAMIMFADIFIEFGRCMNLTLVGSLKAAGDYLAPLIIGLITMWGLGVTVGYGLGVVVALGVGGVFFGTATDECVRGFILMYRWYKRKWIGKSLVER